MPSQSSEHSTSFFEKYRFFLVMVCAALFIEIPFISVPFKWFESYFHEISHGLAAVLTGGNIVRIQLFPNGAGLCTTQGGSRFLISFFGYAGAAIWGVLIYWFASMHQRIAQIFAICMALLLLVTLIFWSRDILTIIIISLLLCMTLLKFKWQDQRYFQLSLQFVGAVVLFNSLKSPWYLFDGRSLGDGATLASLTGIPEVIWIITWFLVGIFGLYLLAKRK